MPARCLPIIALLAVALPQVVLAQASAPASKPMTSAPTAKADSNFQTPEQKRNLANEASSQEIFAGPPGSPTGAPQISIPLGQKPGPQTSLKSGARGSGNAAVAGGINDSAAACLAQEDAAARAACQARLANKPAKPR